MNLQEIFGQLEAEDISNKNIILDKKEEIVMPDTVKEQAKEQTSDQSLDKSPKQMLLKDLPKEKGFKIAMLLKLTNPTIKKKKDDKPYLVFSLTDSSMTLPGKKWDYIEGDEKKYKEKVVFLTGETDFFKEALSLTAVNLAFPDTDVEKEFLSMLPTSSEVKPTDSEISTSRPSKEEYSNYIANQKPLKELKPGDTIQHILRLVSVDLKDSKSGKSYAYFKLGDGSIEYTGNRWESNSAYVASFKDTTRAVFAQGKLESYKDKIQFKLEEVIPLEDISEAEMQPLYISSIYGINFLKQEIWGYVQRIENPWLRKICEAFLQDPKLKERFAIVPAGANKHHAFRHGLCEHVYRLMLLLEDACNSYNKHMYPNSKVKLSLDLLIAGALWHDGLKALEYDPNGTYAVEGNLMGHISRGLIEIGSKSASIPDFPDEIRDLLGSVVSSHHGLVEWGSPDTFCNPESITLHYFDDWASKLDPVMAALNDLPEGAIWTDSRVRAIDKPAHLGGMLLEKYNEKLTLTKASLEKMNEIQNNINMLNDSIKECEKEIRYIKQYQVADNADLTKLPCWHPLHKCNSSCDKECRNQSYTASNKEWKEYQANQKKEVK